MKHLFSLILCFFLALSITSCSKNPFEMQLESLQALEQAMRMNVDNPEALFLALDQCIEKYTPVWEQIAVATEHNSLDTLNRQINLKNEPLREVLNNIIDLDLEIQDRFKNDPELLRAYMERVRRIGTRELTTVNH